MPLKFVRSFLLCLPLTLLSQSAGFGQAIISWDFEESKPVTSSSFAYAFQGSPNCIMETNNNDQVSVAYDSSDGTAHATIDSTNWEVTTNACWSGAGWAMQFAHVLDGTQSLSSGDLSEYNLSFDAWIEGADALRTRLQLQFVDDRELDDGEPTTRLWLENNLQFGDGDLEPLILTAEMQNFTVNLAELGFRDGYSVDDFATHFDGITSLSLTVQSEGVSGLLPAESTQALGFDADNTLYLDNIVLEGPVGVFVPKCNAETAGDLDGSGTVDFADFLVLSGNFGQPAEDHTFGDIDCSGNVDFADFLVLSGNFGKTLKAEAQSVPEPSSAWLGLVGVLALLDIRRRLSCFS